MRTYVALLAAGSLAATLLAAGCGGSLDCGPGTHAANGFCVQDNPMSCDPATAELVDGVCQAKPGGGTCGPGTKQNPANPDECVPDCGAGTALDPVTKKCVPSNSLVQPNVVEKASDENNDPLTEGTPISFTLPGVGSETILAGVIGAPTDDGQGGLVADFDGWQFTTAGPVLLEIEGLPVSHIRFAFFVAPASDPTAVQRFGFDAEAGQAHRRLWIPTAGDWVLVATDADNFNAWWNGSSDAPVGADDSGFNYAFRVRNLAVPAFDNLPPATPMVGSYNDGVKFYSIAPTTGQVVEFWNVPDAADVYAASALYSPENAYKRGAFGSLLLARAGGTTLFFVADHGGALGANLGVTYQAKVVSPDDLGALSAPLTRTAQVIAAANESKYYRFTLTGDGIIAPKVSVPTGSDATPAVAVYDAQMNPVIALSTDPQPAFRTGTGAVEYIARVTDADGAGGSTYTFDLSIKGGPATATAESEPNDTAGGADVGTGFPLVFTGTLSSDTDKDYYSFTLSAPTDLVLLTTADPALGMDTFLELFDSTGTTTIAENDDINGLGCAFGYPEYCLSRIDRTAQAAGTYLVAVSTNYQTQGAYQLLVIAP